MVRSVTDRLVSILGGVAADVRSGRLLAEQPHAVRFCTCCEGSSLLVRCDRLLSRPSRSSRPDQRAEAEQW